jgi:hypothetical protein
MNGKIRLPSAAMVVACLALLVAMSGTAVAASPIVKRALFANNAGKLQGKTAAAVAAMPSPASSAAALVSVKTSAVTLGPNAEQDFNLACDAGTKAISGGFSTTGAVGLFDSRPNGDSAWALYLVNFSQSQAASVTLYAVCLG